MPSRPPSPRWRDGLWIGVGAAVTFALTRGPIYRVRYDWGPFSGDFVDDRWVQGAFGLLYLVALAAGASAWSRSRQWSVTARVWAAAALALPVVTLAAVGWAVDRGRAADQAVLLLLGTAGALMLGARLGLRRLLSAALLGTQAALAAGMWAVIREWPLSRDTTGKWAGVFFNRNSFAGPAAIGLLLLASLLLVDRTDEGSSAMRRAVRVGAPVVILVDIVVLVRTESLTPFFGVLMGAAFVAVAAVARRSSTARTAGVIAPIVLATAFVVWRGLLLLRPEAGRIGRSPNLEGRTFIWHVVRQFVDRRPIGGWGLNAVWTQPDIHYAFLNFGGGGYDVNEAHNGFYEVMLAAGVLGLVALAACLVAALWIVSRHVVAVSGAFGHVPLFALGYVLAINLTESYVGANLLPWWLLLAIVTAALRDLDTTRPAVLGNSAEPDC